jgi:hypothetical protein
MLSRIRSKPNGWTFSGRDFTDITSRNYACAILRQLHSINAIHRLRHGIYLHAVEPTTDADEMLALRLKGFRGRSHGQVASWNDWKSCVPTGTGTQRIRTPTDGKPQAASRPKSPLGSPRIRVTQALERLGRGRASVSELRGLAAALHSDEILELQEWVPSAPAWMRPLLTAIIAQD